MLDAVQQRLMGCPLPVPQIPPNGPQYDCRGACAVSVYDKMFKTAAGNAITACMGTVPGYWFTVAFVDTIGRVPIQFMGESPSEPPDTLMSIYV